MKNKCIDSDLVVKTWFRGLIEYQRVGAVSCLSVCGVDIYQRVASVRSLFGYAWISK
jgi:hypothetical protein